MAQEEDHPIFGDIRGGNLEEVQRRVRADASVLEERNSYAGWTPLMHAMIERQPAIALWLIEHRGQHDLESTDDHYEQTALHFASCNGLLPAVEALVEAGANPAALDLDVRTPLILAADNNRADVVAFLLQQPAVKATIDAVTRYSCTALSVVSFHGRLDIVQLLLDAGADPTIPAGQRCSPLNRATDQGRHAVAALLRTAIAEPDHARALHKARALLDAALAVTKVSTDEGKKDLTMTEQQRAVVAAAPEYLQGRVALGKELPMVEIRQQQQEEQQQQQEQEAVKGRLRATAAFVLGFDGDKYKGLPKDLYVELLGFMLPRWADKGPEA